MRNSPLTTVLLVILVVSALASVLLCWLYISNTRQLRVLQTQIQMVNNNRALITSLANECLEYSKKNPAIDPLLESAGIKPGRTPSAPAKPVTK